MTLAFEFNHKNLFFVVSLILVFSVATVSAQTDICNIETEFLNLTEKNVSLESYQIIEVDFDHTFNTIYFNPKVEREKISFRFRSDREFQVYDLRIYKENKLVSFNPRPQISINGKEYYLKRVIPTGQMENVKVTFLMDNVVQKRSDKWYPFDVYSVFLNNQEIKNGSSISRKYCFPNVDIKLNISPNVIVKYITNESPPRVFLLRLPSVKSGYGSVRMLGPITHTNERQVEHIIIEPYAETYGPIPFDLDISFQRGSLTKFIFVIMVLYLTFVTTYVVGKAYNNNFWEKVSKVYVTYSILPWLFSEITTTITPPNRPLTITIFDYTIIWPFVLIGFWWAWANRKQGISKFKGLFSRRD